MMHWRTSTAPVPYEAAIQYMEQRVEAIAAGAAPETIWLLEHPALLTLGTSGDVKDIKVTSTLPIYRTGRGGKVTYHGPGQRVVYVMLNLKERARRTGHIDLRGFVSAVEGWVAAALGRFGLQAEPRCGRVGLWVGLEGDSRKEAKIAAIGLRIRKGISYHGAAINVDPDLKIFDTFVPCGLAGYGVTSLRSLGLPTTMADLDRALKTTFDQIFTGDLRHATNCHQTT